MSTAGDTEQELTRKERREEARTQRKALEAAESAQATRRKRLIQLGGVFAVVIVAIVVIVLATGGSSKKGIVKGAKATATTTAVSTLLKDIPQKLSVLGKPGAPVALQYFGDLECPVCAEFTLGALPALIKKYVREGKLKIEYRSLQTATREISTFADQQAAALAAGKQGLMWNYLELFYREQGQEGSGYVTENFLQGIAKQVNGLDLGKWTSDRTNSTLAAMVTTDQQAAVQAGFSGTPSFLLSKSGEAPKTFSYTSLTDPSGFESAIDKLLT